jgi:ATP-binding cassette subfamily B protein
MKLIKNIGSTFSLFVWSVKNSFNASPSLFILGYSFTILTSIFYIVYVRLQGNLVDAFTHVQSNLNGVIIAAAVFLGFTLFQDIVAYFQNSFIDLIGSSKTEKYFTEKFLSFYSKLDIGRIEQAEFQNLRDKVSSRGLWQMRMVPSKIALIIGNLITILISISVISTIHPLAALAIVIGTIPAFIIDIRHTSAVTKLWDDYTFERRIYWSARWAIESKRSAQELIISNRASRIITKVFHFINGNYRREVAIEKRFIAGNIIAKVISVASMGVALYFIISQALQGVVTPGYIVFAFGVLYQISSSVTSIVSNIASFKEVLPYIRYTKEFFATMPLVQESEKPIKVDTKKPVEIVFENVSFSYPGHEVFVLHNISFTIPAGEKLALVGLNGAGKSTIIKLLLRMYDPTVGRILVDGIDLKNVDLNSWYEHLGVLLQDFSRYEFLSIKDTIKLFAKKKLADKEIRHLLKSIQADSIVDGSTEGIDLIQSTEYGGKELSGGQFQKIAIARTLSRNAQFIVLDEPTSSIDALSEEAIFKTLHALPENVTMLFISHRFTTIRNAEHIIVLNDGTIAEQGTHEQLMKGKHLYAKMYKTQVLGTDN